MPTYQNLVCKTVYFEVYGLIVAKLERFKSYAGRQRLTNADINKSGIKTQLQVENSKYEKGMMKNDKISYLRDIRY